MNQPKDIFSPKGDVYHEDWLRNNWASGNNEASFKLILPHIRPGTIVVDGGAYIGVHSWAYLDALRGEGRLLAFEPNPEAARAFKLNLNQHAFRNWNLIHCALGSSTTRSRFRVAKNKESSYLAPRGDLWVNIRRLDQIAEAWNKPISFIKLDVEGGEIEALRGAQRLIGINHPVMWIESNPFALRRFDASPANLVSVLEALGYQIESHHYPGCIEPETGEPISNLLCLPR
jgi:FkbM family methyltransferase